MTRLNDIDALLDGAEELYKRIQTEYEQALETKTLSILLPVYIKNYLENLRSALDYMASEISEEVLSLGKSHKPYFPIVDNSEIDFRTHMKKNLPDLENILPSLFSFIESMQPYQQAGYKFISKLSKLVNENKHNRLSPQTVSEQKGLDINFSGGAKISMGPGSSISGGGIISSGDSWISPAGGSISGEEPVKVGGGNINQTVIKWISFTFDESGENVLDLLRGCRSEVKMVVEGIKPHL